MAPSILVYGFGNIGRQDDGLGVLLAEKIEQLGLDGVQVEINFQLNAEDALVASQHNLVLFIDASVEIEEDYKLLPLQMDDSIAFSTHAMSPASVLSFCQEVYHQSPECYVLHIRGYEWEFGLPLSEQAQANLEAAWQFVQQWLNERLSDR